MSTRKPDPLPPAMRAAANEAADRRRRIVRLQTAARKAVSPADRAAAEQALWAYVDELEAIDAAALAALTPEEQS